MEDKWFINMELPLTKSPTTLEKKAQTRSRHISTFPGCATTQKLAPSKLAGYWGNTRSIPTKASKNTGTSPPLRGIYVGVGLPAQAIIQEKGVTGSKNGKAHGKLALWT